MVFAFLQCGFRCTAVISLSRKDSWLALQQPDSGDQHPNIRRNLKSLPKKARVLHNGDSSEQQYDGGKGNRAARQAESRMPACAGC